MPSTASGMTESRSPPLPPAAPPDAAASGPPGFGFGGRPGAAPGAAGPVEPSESSPGAFLRSSQITRTRAFTASWKLLMLGLPSRSTAIVSSSTGTQLRRPTLRSVSMWIFCLPAAWGPNRGGSSSTGGGPSASSSSSMPSSGKARERERGDAARGPGPATGAIGPTIR